MELGNISINIKEVHNLKKINNHMHQIQLLSKRKGNLFILQMVINSCGKPLYVHS